MKYLMRFFYLAAIHFAVGAGAVFAQTSEFTYQGKLDVTGMISATYDFEFNLCNTEDCESVLDSNSRPGVAISGGVFTVKLNFAPGEFGGADRFLQIRVKRPTETIYTTLAPTQKITSAPYSIQAATAANSLKLGNVAANQYVLTGDPRLNAGNYVQNTTAPQPTASFNIGGTGTANVLNATTQFNINNLRILSADEEGNLFAGFFAGNTNSGTDNSFFGSFAGQNNSTGSSNSFFGNNAGKSNQTGASNSFFGRFAGRNNTSGFSNSFFGNLSGWQNTTGERNAIFGDTAGFNNSTGANNSFFGWQAGFANTSGNVNTFVGSRAGAANTTGYQNSFFGNEAGVVNTDGFSNAFFGFRAGFNNTNGFSNAFFGDGAGSATTSGNNNSFFGNSAGQLNTTGVSNSFFGTNSGSQNTSGILNAFIGAVAGSQNTVGSRNVFIGVGAGNPNTATQVSNSVAIGANAQVATSNTIVLGTTAETTRIPGKFVAGSSVSNFVGSAHVETFASSGISGIYTGNFILTGIDSLLASPVHLCIRTTTITTIGGGASGGQALTRCTSSFASERDKENVQPFTSGLDVVKRLKPVAFHWKADGASDVGLNAEDVAAVEPNLVTRNAEGEIEDVKENGLKILFINAFKEQQSQIETQKNRIETQQEQLKQQQQQIDRLKKLVCQTNAQAEVCKQYEGIK